MSDFAGRPTHGSRCAGINPPGTVGSADPAWVADLAHGRREQIESAA